MFFHSAEMDSSCLNASASFGFPSEIEGMLNYNIFLIPHFPPCKHNLKNYYKMSCHNYLDLNNNASYI